MFVSCRMSLTQAPTVPDASIIWYTCISSKFNPFNLCHDAVLQ